MCRPVTAMILVKFIKENAGAEKWKIGQQVKTLFKPEGVSRQYDIRQMKMEGITPFNIPDQVIQQDKQR